MTKQGNMIRINPKAQEDAQIRKLLESNFRPVVSQTHDLMMQQFLAMSTHMQKQGELQRLAVMNEVGLRPLREHEAGLHGPPGPAPPGHLRSAFETMLDLGLRANNWGARRFGGEGTELYADEREAAVILAQQEAAANEARLRAAAAARAAESGSLFADANPEGASAPSPAAPPAPAGRPSWVRPAAAPAPPPPFVPPSTGGRSRTRAAPKAGARPPAPPTLGGHAPAPGGEGLWQRTSAYLPGGDFVRSTGLLGLSAVTGIGMNRAVF